MPWRASHTAAQRPADPEPQIMTSYFWDMLDLSWMLYGTVEIRSGADDGPAWCLLMGTWSGVLGPGDNLKIQDPGVVEQISTWVPTQLVGVVYADVNMSTKMLYCRYTVSHLSTVAKCQ